MQASTSSKHENMSQAEKRVTSILSETEAGRLRQRIGRNQVKVDGLKTALGLPKGLEGLALLDGLDRGLQRSIPSRIERLLEDHPKFTKRFTDCLNGCLAVLKDAARQAA